MSALVYLDDSNLWIEGKKVMRCESWHGTRYLGGHGDAHL